MNDQTTPQTPTAPLSLDEQTATEVIAHCIDSSGVYTGVSVPVEQVGMTTRYTTTPIGEIPDGLIAVFDGGQWIYKTFNDSFVHKLKEMQSIVDTIADNLYTIAVGGRGIEYQRVYDEAKAYLIAEPGTPAGLLLESSSGTIFKLRQEIMVIEGTMNSLQSQLSSDGQSGTTPVEELQPQLDQANIALSEKKAELHSTLVQSAERIIAMSDAWTVNMVRIRTERIQCKEIIAQAINNPLKRHCDTATEAFEFYKNNMQLIEQQLKS